MTPRVQVVLEQLTAAFAAGELVGSIPIPGPPLTDDEVRSISIFLALLAPVKSRLGVSGDARGVRRARSGVVG